MHQLYIEKHEPEQYQLRLQNKPCSPVVKYEYFRKFFTENYKISYGNPISDTCQKCDKLEKKINAAESEEELRTLQRDKNLHVTKADTFYADLKDKTALSKRDPNIEVISFDFQQNLPLPVSPSGDVFYKIQLWTYNFCIHIGSTGLSFFMFMTKR